MWWREVRVLSWLSLRLACQAFGVLGSGFRVAGN